MHDCWLEDPDGRQNFSQLVISITDVIQPQIELESLEKLKRNYNPEAAKVRGVTASLSETCESADAV